MRGEFVEQLARQRRRAEPARRDIEGDVAPAEACLGVGGLVDKLVNEGPKWLGGRATFFLGTLRASFAYKNVSVRVTADDKPFFEGPASQLMLRICAPAASNSGRCCS